ncbi:hypothetical protein [Streptomyces sp. HNM1019]|uniref:hypothetical protein n=1 Tax=Streptomyces sp. HNM1019 TaxID=3424717 RepID=UPI003D785C2E
MATTQLKTSSIGGCGMIAVEIVDLVALGRLITVAGEGIRRWLGPNVAAVPVADDPGTTGSRSPSSTTPTASALLADDDLRAGYAACGGWDE